MYIINNLYGFKEEDNYQEGCLPETAFNISLDVGFNGKTQEEIINKIIDYFGTDKESILLNSCEEKGRIDIQILEDEDGLIVTEKDKNKIRLWKEGKIKLWSATYTGYLYKQKLVKWEDEK